MHGPTYRTFQEGWTLRFCIFHFLYFERQFIHLFICKTVNQNSYSCYHIYNYIPQIKYERELQILKITNTKHVVGLFGNMHQYHIVPSRQQDL